MSEVVSIVTDFLISLTWWQLVLCVLCNSLIGYWVGVGTLYCWYNLRLLKRLDPGTVHQNGDHIVVAFLMWPCSTMDRLHDGTFFGWEPLSMDLNPRTYLAGMIMMGPVPKIAFTIFMYCMCLLTFLFRQVARRCIAIPRYIKLR